KHEPDRWLILAMALVEFRAGHDAAAAEWLERFAPRPDGPHLEATALAVLAMLQHRAGRDDAAHDALDEARAILSGKRPDPAAGRAFGTSWPFRVIDCHDWLHAAILVREAEHVLRGETNDNDPTVTEEQNESPLKRGE